ncbi:hypothetical protein LCGC14_0521170 [marine sediment metagenome]|uniref:Uncharacterized protein n=1 Tax=marine sediment metagenome TaxID=412755 RepID=A0A0F9S388_9ZZZZ
MPTDPTPAVLIELRCPECDRAPIMVAREPTDPPEATVVKILCHRCDTGGNKTESVTYA